MNPESSSYGETLYEDSFEYEGNIMLLQSDGDQIYIDSSGGQMYTYELWIYNGQNWVQQDGAFTNDMIPEGSQVYNSMEEGYNYMGDAASFSDSGTDGGGGTMGSEYGVTTNVTSEDILGMGSNEDRLEWIKENVYGGEWPSNEVKNEVSASIEAHLPQLGEVAEEEMGFLAGKYGGGDVSFAESLAGEAAGMTKQADIYGLQKGSKELGKMSWGTGGGGMRAQVAGRKELGKGFETAQERYGAAQTTAGAAYTSGVYGLEQAEETQWQSDFTTFLNSLPSATGD